MTQQNSINLMTYASERVVNSYLNFDELYPAEQRIFADYAAQFAGDVLDIAIGAGRTTRALLPASKSYVGLDFSAGMVGAASKLFPGAQLRQMDMRDVPAEFSGRKFDAILISFNGIDYISWKDRTGLLASLRDLLKPGGVLAFSTHDMAALHAERRFAIREDLKPRLSMLFDSPLKFACKLAKLPLWLLKARWNYHRNRRHEQFFEGYAYVNDAGDNYGLVTTYVDIELQSQLLAKDGYRKIQTFQPWLKREKASFTYITCLRAAIAWLSSYVFLAWDAIGDYVAFCDISGTF